MEVTGGSNEIFSRVTFRCQVATEFGDRVVVVGDSPALGSWNPEEGIFMETTSASYPLWRTGHPVVLTMGVPVQYKYVVIKKGIENAQDFVWENIHRNRQVAPRGDEFIVTDVFEKFGNHNAEVLGRKGNEAATMNRPEPVKVDLEKDGIVVVMMRLPVRLTKDESTGEYSVSIHHEALMSFLFQLGAKLNNVLWVGWPGVEVPKEDQEKVEAILLEQRCVPVFLTNEEVHDFLYKFCMQYLWPIFHNVMDPNAASFDEKLWQVYLSCNKKFADKVVEVYRDGDLIWIQDYHLLVTPSSLLRRLREANMGLFLHCAFPSSEIFRNMPVRDQLLRGMLSCDLVGFHLFEYTRHFITCCKRLLGLPYEFKRGGFLSIETNGRRVMVVVSHVGTEPTVIRDRAASKAVQQKREIICKKTIGKKVIASVDALTSMNGLGLKLLAFEKLLDQYPIYREYVVLVQMLTDQFSHVDDCQETEAKLDEIVRRIQGKYGEDCIVWMKHPPDLDYRLDIMLVTSIKEGMNLWPFEFSVLQDDGVLILSEFCGASRALSGRILVNPWSSEEVASAIDTAISMSGQDKQSRMTKNREYVEHRTIVRWAQSFLNDLKACQKPNGEYIYMGLGLGSSYRVLGIGAHFKNLRVDDVLAGYRKSRNRLLLLDHEGTLVPGSADAGEISAPSMEVLRLFEELTLDDANTVFVLSGRSSRVLEQWFGRIDGLGLVAEHGFYYRWGWSGRWLCAGDHIDLAWMEVVQGIMETYTNRVTGSFIEKKGSGCVWQYRDADPEFGSLLAKELEDHLTSVLSDFHVDVVGGKGYVEVKPRGFNKGVMVEKILGSSGSNRGSPSEVDFVFCIGDDRSDEAMFSALNLHTEGIPSSHFFTCTVGRKPSHARYFLNDTDEVLEVLKVFQGYTARVNRNRSMIDLRQAKKLQPQ